MLDAPCLKKTKTTKGEKMDIITGKYNSMPGDYDTLGTGAHTGNYAGFYVDEDVTYTSITTMGGVKAESKTIVQGSTIPVSFTAITITAGQITAYKG